MIEFTCTCGRKYRVKDEMAGRKGKCKECGATMQVPQAALVQAKQSQKPAQPKMGPKGKVRDPFKIVVLNVVTLTIYQYIWIYWLWNEAHNYAAGLKGVKIKNGKHIALRYMVLPFSSVFLCSFAFGIASAMHARAVQNIIRYHSQAIFYENISVILFIVLSILVVASMIITLLLLVRTPDLIRQMRLAIGMPKDRLGNPSYIALTIFIPFVGPLVYWYATQSAMNRFWSEEAI